MNKTKDTIIFVLTMLSGLLLGSCLGSFLTPYPYFSWLGYTKTFGIVSPLILDLDIFVLHFAFTINFSASGIIGLIIAFIIYKKVIK